MWCLPCIPPRDVSRPVPHPVCVRQVALCVGQTFWTTGMHKAIRAGVAAIGHFLEEQRSDLSDIVALVRVWAQVGV